MLDRVFRYFDALVHMSPMWGVALMIAGAAIFFFGSRDSTGRKTMTRGQTSVMVLGVVLFFMGLFPILCALPSFLPSLR